MSLQRDLAIWLEETSRRDDTPGRLRKLVVCHIVKGNKIGDEIRAVTVPDVVDEDWRDATANKVIEQGVAEAATLASGIQKYAVQAFFEGDDKPRGRHIFTVQGPDEDDDKISTESNDEAGVLGQSRRLTEFFGKEFARSTGFHARALMEENERLRKANNELLTERMKTVKMVEELMSARHERELAMTRERQKAKVLDDTVSKLGLLVPMAVNHMAGRKVLPENAPERLLLQSFAETMTAEKMTAMAGVLDATQMAALWHIMQSVATPAPDSAKPASDAAPSNGVHP